MRYRLFGGGALAASALLLAGTVAADQAVQSDRPSWRSPAGEVARGQGLAQACLACHGENPTAAAGLDRPPPKLFRQRASYLFFALREYRDGTRKHAVMQGFAQGLSDQDMRDIAAYFGRNLPDKPPKPDPGKPIYETTSRECGFCHGETGIGEFEGIPVLAGQERDYLMRALEDYRSGKRGDPTMRAELKRIAPEKDAALADYYAGYQWLEHKE
ncbi:c-type cytochrome [Sphingomonas canadensis]|uniref:C-type cytochrome n=1 Tax=Sphingomonas canadensis TaxID=1219257 RepID=A0ABW3HGD6_9SPHN|nr:c-type cytochrome [Sphingomonas canadensis]MCW3838292.1 c-type cytochrome [Sphingomonas canadensis]